MKEIERYAGACRGRNRAVAYGDLVFTVATAQDAADTVAGQTRATLERIERNLADAGSDKTRLLSATVYLADIESKPEMDEQWNAWIGDDGACWPQRACVQAGLAGDTLVEITVVAARG